MSNSPRDGKPGTTDQWPRWEGSEETRPSGYLPAVDDPRTAPDAAGETPESPQGKGASQSATTDAEHAHEARIAQRAYERWESEGKPDGQHERHWHEAVKDIHGEAMAQEMAPATKSALPRRVAAKPTRRTQGEAGIIDNNDM